MIKFYLTTIILLGLFCDLNASNKQCDFPKSWDQYSFTSTCTDIKELQIIHFHAVSGYTAVCQLKAKCTKNHGRTTEARIKGHAGDFPETCDDIINQNGKLKCITDKKKR